MNREANRRLAMQEDLLGEVTLRTTNASSPPPPLYSRGCVCTTPVTLSQNEVPSRLSVPRPACACALPLVCARRPVPVGLL